jgi:hypothetical protein
MVDARVALPAEILSYLNVQILHDICSCVVVLSLPSKQKIEFYVIYP